MKNQSDLRFTFSDQYGSRVVIEGHELDRVTEYWGLQRILQSCYDDVDASQCPSCGTTLARAIETGLMGCPACYNFIYPNFLVQTSDKP